MVELLSISFVTFPNLGVRLPPSPPLKNFQPIAVLSFFFLGAPGLTGIGGKGRSLVFFRNFKWARKFFLPFFRMREKDKKSQKKTAQKNLDGEKKDPRAFFSKDRRIFHLTKLCVCSIE